MSLPNVKSKKKGKIVPNVNYVLYNYPMKKLIVKVFFHKWHELKIQKGKSENFKLKVIEIRKIRIISLAFKEKILN